MTSLSAQLSITLSSATVASLIEECNYVVDQQVYFIKRDVINTTGKIKEDLILLDLLLTRAHSRKKLMFDPWSPQNGKVAFPSMPDTNYWNSSIKLRNLKPTASLRDADITIAEYLSPSFLVKKAQCWLSPRYCVCRCQVV